MLQVNKNIVNHTGAAGVGNKRTADGMLQSNGNSPVMSPSVETVNSDTQSDTENYNRKRPRLDGDSESVANDDVLPKVNPSKVLHIRNLPQDTSETDIMVLATPFGSVTNIILMRNKRQAFVEMGSVGQAQNLVNKFQNPNSPATVHNQPVQVQYSATYQELKPGQRSHASGMKPTPVLHVNIENAMIPITLATLHNFFSRFGIVEKIITFNKNNQFQALIQMGDVRAAQTAKSGLDGKSVYHNYCTLRIDFSKMLSVNVKYNNEKSRDFTNPNLPSSDNPNIPALPPTVAGSSTTPRIPVPAAARALLRPAGLEASTAAHLQSMGIVPYGSRLPTVPTSSAAAMAALNAYSPLQVPSNMSSALPAYRMVNGINQQVLPGANPTSVQTPVGLLPHHLTASQLQLIQQQQQQMSLQQNHQAAAQLQIQQQQLASVLASQLQNQSTATQNPALAQLTGMSHYMTSRGSSLASATASSASQESLSPEHNALETPPPSAAANHQLQINPTVAALGHQHFKQQANGDGATLTAAPNPLLLVNGLNSQVCYQSTKLQ